MPCCQLCVFAFTAFLIVAERTAGESYLGHARARARALRTINTTQCTILHRCARSLYVGGMCVRDRDVFYLTLLACACTCARAFLCVPTMCEGAKAERDAPTL